MALSEGLSEIIQIRDPIQFTSAMHEQSKTLDWDARVPQLCQRSLFLGIIANFKNVFEHQTRALYNTFFVRSQSAAHKHKAHSQSVIHEIGDVS